MQAQDDELDLEIQRNSHYQYQGIFSFPYQLQTPKLQPYLINQYGEQALQMPQSVKYLNQIYPMNQTMEARQEELKRFFGLKYLFGLEGKSESDFLEDIDAQIFNASFFDDPNLVDLSKFFQDQEAQSQEHQHRKLLDDLTKRLSQIQNKAFTGISIHKTIGNAFFEHFSNFSSLRNQSEFFQNFQISFDKFFMDSKRIKKSGPHLILMIYEFWMRMFRQFVRQIWRHSEKYSLDMFKKNKDIDKQNTFHSSKSSTSSSQQGQKIEKDKRKPWSKDQIQILQKIIESNGIFNNIRLQKLAQQFGRSSTSISSKIQKIIKLRKSNFQNNFQQDISLDKKIEVVLKLYPEGLSKEVVIKRINQMYEMGLQDNWKKSVCQILSSKKNILKIKGCFRLLNPHQYCNYVPRQTLRDKVIRCLIESQNDESDLKGLSQKYMQLFGKQQNIDQNDKEKLKILETNISKCLNRYDIFQKTNQKIIYKLNNSQTEKIDYCMDVQDYMD